MDHMNVPGCARCRRPPDCAWGPLRAPACSLIVRFVTLAQRSQHSLEGAWSRPASWIAGGSAATESPNGSILSHLSSTVQATQAGNTPEPWGATGRAGEGVNGSPDRSARARRCRAVIGMRVTRGGDRWGASGPAGLDRWCRCQARADRGHGRPGMSSRPQKGPPNDHSGSHHPVHADADGPALRPRRRRPGPPGPSWPRGPSRRSGCRRSSRRT